MSRSRENGFTLIELLLALAIFTIIGVATTKHLQQIQNTKTIAFEEIDLYSDVRAVVSLMRSDLSQAFHVPYDDLDNLTRQALMQGNQNVPHTLFDGRKNELIFTSLSHRVYYAGKRECQQAEISYFLQRKGKNNLPSLMKRESGFIDSDLYQGGSIYTLLDNVQSLEFQYWDEKTEKWVDDWSSDNGQYRDHFPMAVKMKLAVVQSTGQVLKVESQFKVAFPNNDRVVVQF